MRKVFGNLIVAVIISSSFLWAQDPSASLNKALPEYLKLTNQYNKALKDQESLTIGPNQRLRVLYLEKMRTLQERAQNSGDLKKAVAAEEAAVEPTKGSIDKNFDEIASLQKIFLKEKKKILDKKIAAQKSITSKYISLLKKLEIKLTKAGNLKEALQINRKIESLIGESNYPNNGAAPNLRPNPIRDFAWRAIGEIIEIQKYIANNPKVVIPSTIDGKPVEILGPKCFQNCRDVTSIIIPDSVVKIGGAAFSSVGVKNLVIPDSVTEIGGAFVSAPQLESLRLSKNLKELPRYCLQNLVNLKELIIPEGVKKIPYRFLYSSNLKDLDLPESIEEISSQAFYSCNLGTLKIPENVKTFEAPTFVRCKIRALIFEGSPPKINIPEKYPNTDVFGDIDNTFDITLYRYSDASGWEEKWCGRDVTVIER